MSVNDSTESVFQTPNSVVLVEEIEATHPELEPHGSGLEGEDIGASPTLEPVTRSGKKRKHTAPVKSSGKKKTKMIRSPNKTGADGAAAPDQNKKDRVPGDVPVVPPSPTAQAPDLAAMLAKGLSDIQSSMGGMEARLGGKIDALEVTVKSNENKISSLTSIVNENSSEVSALRERMDASKLAMDRKIGETVRSQFGQDPGALSFTSIRTDGGVGPARTTAQIASYWKCRKSLRLWPIGATGSGTLSLQQHVIAFLVEQLQFTESMVDEDFGQFDVERVVDPRSKVEREAVVEFASSALRDSVKGSGYRLEGKRAGIRIEVPNNLKSDFHVLQSISYKMMMANPGIKRSVKFDDENYGLVLDVQIPGQDWRRIRPDQARAARNVDSSLGNGPRELSGDMIAGAILDRPVPASQPTLTGGNATSVT